MPGRSHDGLRHVGKYYALDDAADLLEDMPAGVVKRVLEKSSKQTRESLNKLLNYPESSAGSLMTPEYVRLREDMTVEQAFDAIRKQGENAETVYTCYVVERNRLKGVVSARSLLLSDRNIPVSEIMDDNVVAVKVTDDQEYVAREMQRYDFTAMPVLDNEGMFVGIITIDDAIDVLTDESTEDMQKMAAILPDDDATTYFGTSVWTHAKQRIPWLLILMLSATFTGMVTTHYEEAFTALPLLVSFMPMLMDTAGNCGNQISTLMVRGLALGEVEPADFLKVLAKELRVSAIVGAVLGVVNGLRIYLMYTFIFAGQYDNVIGYAIVVSVSLFFSVILAKLVGGMLPLAAKKLGADPAIMATVAMDIDGAGLPFLKNLTPPAGSKSVQELTEIIRYAAMPFIVKGVMTVRGAQKAAEAGAAAIIVSNHGGRVLGQTPASAEVLAEIADAVGGSMKIFVDGGIRTGTDVFKALALGADAVLIGRPFVPMVYGDGAQGVATYIEKIGSELRDTMAMCGVRTLGEITRDCVRVL